MVKRKRASLLAVLIILVLLAGCTGAGGQDEGGVLRSFDGVWYSASTGAACTFDSGTIYRTNSKNKKEQTLAGIYDVVDDHIEANLAGVGDVTARHALYLVSTEEGLVLCSKPDGSGTVYFYQEIMAVLKRLDAQEEAKAAMEEEQRSMPIPAVDAGEPADPEPTPETGIEIANVAPSQEAAPTGDDTPVEGVVWVTKSGKKYHSTPSCSGMKSPIKLTLAQAKSKGYTPCKRCH